MIDINRDIRGAIESFNRDRNQKILTRKYVNLRKTAFAFFRGTCHLFYHDLPDNLTKVPVPNVWICGDLHLENFGTYKGDDRQIYFGINDFDEGVIAPCLWDLTRLVTSIFVACESLAIDETVSHRLAEAYLTSYANALSTGKIRTVSAGNAQGIVKELLIDLHQRKRMDLLVERTELTKHHRQLYFDDDKLWRIDRQTYQLVEQSIANWAKDRANPDFFEVLDIGFRIAGNGSLGLDRYLILITGKGSPDRNYLLDLKQQPISALQPYLTSRQPDWQNQATRVMKVQQLVQSAPPALTAALEFNSSSYFLRELQPTQDKITLKANKFSFSQLQILINTMGEITAATHLHGSGKSGAAIADDLMSFGSDPDWQPDIINYSREYAHQVQLDYQDFCRSKPPI